MDAGMGDNADDKLMKEVFKYAINHLFWKRMWFRKWFIRIPVWMPIAIFAFGHDAYHINFYVSLYCFLFSLSLYDNEDMIDDDLEGYQGRKIEKIFYIKEKTKKLRAKKAAH
jgi:hypothetical protein